MKPIARDLNQIEASYTAVVIGSGYGGGIAASRLARAGQSVCLLERGKELLPGEYPSSIGDTVPQVQIDSELERHGDPTALFDIRMNNDVTAVVGCGLGGTSLINANVSLEIDRDLFTAEHWPAVFRDNPDLMAPYYDRARSVLDPTPYPQEDRPLDKVAALERSAETIGANFSCPPINVNFVDKINAFGVYQPACNNCGDCVSGCNYGSKNTTLMNYLPDAHNHGASIFTEASVLYIERVDERWKVHIKSLSDDIPDTNVLADVVVLAAGTLGSTEILKRSEKQGLTLSPQLGQHFSGNGDVLGFGYNNKWDRPETGTIKLDELTSAIGGPSSPWKPINGIGKGTNKIDASKMPGPCIAGLIDMRDAPDFKDRLVIEEGVIPGALAAAVTPGFFFANTIAGDPLKYGPMEAQARLQDAADLAIAIQKDPSSLASDAYSGPLNRTQTYLMMSIDEADGELELVDDRLRISWPGAGSAGVFSRDNEILSKVNSAIHGQFMPNPMWSGAMGRQLVTVHPVGGCAMGDDWDHGVVNDRSQVFSSSDEVYDGLYVCDGSVMPGSVGVNPLLTISALAERSIEHLVGDRGWSIDFTMDKEKIGHQPFASPSPGHPVGPPPRGIAQYLQRVLQSVLAFFRLVLSLLLTGAKKLVTPIIKAIIKWVIKHHPESVAPSLSFKETMDGWYSDEYKRDDAPSWERISDRFELAAELGKLEGREMDFTLVITADNLARFNADPKHTATVEGVVRCKSLSATDMTVKDGTFELLPPDPDHVDQWLMVYDMPLERTDGPMIKFRGIKHLKRLPGSDVWTDLTKLEVTVTELGDEEPITIGEGILTLDLQDFVRQAFTMELNAPDRWFSKIGWLDRAFKLQFAGKFAANFGMTVIQAYGGILSDLKNFDAAEQTAHLDSKTNPPRPLTVDPPIVTTIRADHKVAGASEFDLKLYHYPGGSKGPVILAPGFAINASSYAIDTVDQNIVEYLHENDYDVWLFAYSGSPDSGSSTREFNLDDIAKYDWPAAVAAVREQTGRDVQIIAHCVASMTILMSLLDDRVQGVKSLICSQTTVHPVLNWLNNMKADLGIVPMIRHIDAPKYGIDFSSEIDMKPTVNGTEKEIAGSRLIDAAMWMMPVPEGEGCTNPACHRMFGLFGPTWTHSQLNHDTHIAIADMTGKVSTAPFQQIADIVAAGYAVDAEGNDCYLPNVERLKLPIDFLAGRLNRIFLPETSERTFEWAVAHNGPEFYTRKVFADYAHMDIWIGKNANRDIFPYVLECLDRHNDA